MPLYHRLGDVLLGYAGLALLRSHVEDLGGKAFADARVADIQRVLEHWDDEPTFQWQATWEDAPAADAYAVWASTYDSENNPLIDLDDATLRPLLDRYPAGKVLDAACGTGRWAKYLSARDHAVIGVDESPAMLAKARDKVPSVEFLEGDLRSLPVADASIDLVVCSLALTHLPELDGVFAEFARVLRRGGTAIISNIHYLAMLLNGVPKVRTPSGATIHAPASPFLISDYANAAIRSGFEIRSCAEPAWPDLDGGHGGPMAQHWCPGSVDAACIGTPALIVLELGRLR